MCATNDERHNPRLSRFTRHHLRWHRGAGQQSITVRHVTVNADNAIVANIEQPSGGGHGNAAICRQQRRRATWPGVRVRSPQAVQVKRSSMSESRTSSGHSDNPAQSFASLEPRARPGGRVLSQPRGESNRKVAERFVVGVVTIFRNQGVGGRRRALARRLAEINALMT
jgi:hypothetical protein